MSRISLVTSFVIIVLGISALPASTAEQTLKQQIQGAWNLVSCDAKRTIGDAPTQICVNTSGSLSLNGNGRYTTIVASKNRPTTSRENATPESLKAIAQGFAAQFGTWSVNDADKTLTFHAEEELFPRPGSEYKQTIVSVTADEMRTNGPLGNAVWRRFK